MHDLEHSSAACVWRFFEEICAIPHGSGHEDALLAHIQSWAAGKGFKTAQDKARNLVVYAPGSPGYEKAPTLILQSHVDMVCEKNGSSTHDFEKDPIRLVREGDVLRADGTTLGADNGIGAAIMLAALDGDAPHPPIEAVFTVNEEIGLVGASLFDMGLVSGKRLLNLDAEEEGVFMVSNAGGQHARLALPAQWQEVGGLYWLWLSVTGLQGGHSGMDIDKERGNAIRLMGRVLDALREEEPGFLLAEMQAGSKENAIPRESVCLVGLPQSRQAAAESLAVQFDGLFKKELAQSDAGVCLQCRAAPAPQKAFTAELRDKLIAATLLLPNGVQSMSREIPGLVESSNNLGVVLTTEREVQLLYTVRSSVKSRKEAIARQIAVLEKMLGGHTGLISDYPAWEYQPQSALRDLFARCYEALNGKPPRITAVHCGLECGTFADAIEGLDVLAIGPELTDVHSPQERVSIASTERVWQLILAALAEMKE